MSKRLHREVEKLVDYVDPSYNMTKETAQQVKDVRAEFNAFFNKMLQLMPAESDEIKSPYLFNAHAGAFARRFDEAKDEFMKALLAATVDRTA
jgi:hypothetical protein